MWTPMDNDRIPLSFQCNKQIGAKWFDNPKSKEVIVGVVVSKLSMNTGFPTERKKRVESLLLETVCNRLSLKNFLQISFLGIHALHTALHRLFVLSMNQAQRVDISCKVHPPHTGKITRWSCKKPFVKIFQLNGELSSNLCCIFAEKEA